MPCTVAVETTETDRDHAAGKAGSQDRGVAAQHTVGRRVRGGVVSISMSFMPSSHRQLSRTVTGPDCRDRLSTSGSSP